MEYTYVLLFELNHFSIIFLHHDYITKLLQVIFFPPPQSCIICNTRDVTDDWLDIAIVSWGHISVNMQYKAPKLNSETKALPKLIPESGTSIYIKFLSFQEKGERGPKHHLCMHSSVLHLIESILTDKAVRIFWRVGFIIHSPDI